MGGSKKSQAQLRRLQQRAAARGEAYVPPEPSASTRTTLEEPPKKKAKEADDDDADENDGDASSMNQSNEDIKTNEDNENEKQQQQQAQQTKKWMTIVDRFQNELNQIETNDTLKAKDRRSAKRKAEAVATEDAGIPVPELLQWYEKQKEQEMTKNTEPTNGKNKEDLQKQEKEQRQVAAAIQLKKELEEIETNESLKAKERRSAKRKAEAIAAEASGMTCEALLEWYETFGKAIQTLQNAGGTTKNKTATKKRPSHDPYIVFIGQLSFETTADELFRYIQDQLQKDSSTVVKIKSQDIKIRLLTDPKTKKSRGMAFVEVENPDLLYGLLKLHQTMLNGRRINVERSAGGKKNSEARQAKLSQYRKEQEEYFAEVVNKILKEYKDTGELREGELDDGVIALCQRHAGPVVRAAMAEYIEKGGRDMDNPSAYLSFLVTKFATEGIREDKDKGNKGEKHKSSNGVSFGKRKMSGKGDSATTSSGNGRGGMVKKKFKQSSEFVNAGVDMSLSEKHGGAGGNSLAKVFPSARRGRGRGYM